MPVLTVLTAAIGKWAEFVREAGESVGAQELPAGWEVEWVVQEDGAQPCLADLVGAFPFARYESNGLGLGIAATRNLGLARARGAWLFVLDCDDLILPGGLRVVAETIDRNPGIHWVATQADNLLAGGERLAFEPISPTGHVPAGAVSDFVLTHGKAPFLLTGMALRTATVRALGGWLAVPHGEDFGLVVAVAELAAGYYPPEVVWLYRQHDQQTSRSPEWLARRESAMELVCQRIDAVRAMGLRCH
jgi:glycosyltransferase involved in cell wall biosynthesis